MCAHNSTPVTFRLYQCEAKDITVWYAFSNAVSDEAYYASR
jgi:hypothetical protein